MCPNQIFIIFTYLKNPNDTAWPQFARRNELGIDTRRERNECRRTQNKSHKKKIPITRARLRFSALAGIQVFVCVWFFFVFRLNSKLHALKRRPLRRGDHETAFAPYHKPRPCSWSLQGPGTYRGVPYGAREKSDHNAIIQ